MKEFRLIIGVLLVVFSKSVFGQQDPTYTQYMYTMSVLNPAYAGSKGYTSMSLLGRTQWVGVEGAPRAATFALHAPLGRSLGMGVSVVRNEVGPVKEDNLFVDFSYTIKTGEVGNLALGLKAGVNLLNVRQFSTLEPDPLNVPVNLTSPNFGVGAFYYTDNFYFGLSVPNLLETRYLEDNAGIVSTASRSMHYFVTSGYVIDLSDDLKLKPSALLRTTLGAPLAIDYGLNLFVNENVEVGLAHSIDNSISGMLALQVNNMFRIGYSYDYTTTNFGNFNSGTHEIMLLFDFNGSRLKRLRCF